jgi:hypothetical protein
MKKSFALAVLFIASTGFIQAQFTRYVVQFTDKKGTPYSLTAPSAYLSDKAIARRTTQHIPIDSTDLPLTPAYLDSIRNVPNVTILNISKWLNQVLIKTSDSSALIKINSFPFVKKTNPLAPRISTVRDPSNEIEEDVTPVPSSRNQRQMGVTGTDDFNYGSTYNQIHIHEGEYLHNLGYNGKGMTIAIIDAGFYMYLSNPVFDSVRLQGRVLGTWDYVNNKASVNEEYIHGAYVFSVLAANRPGVMVGAAPYASYWLLKTEDTNSEYPVEEQNWIAAAEFADSAGVDMISTSLGYSDFDNPAFSLSYAQRNGHTAMISIAADMAVKKGILVVVAAGNSGASTTDEKYVACPADADSVLTVGAVDKYGNIANFSSWGPNGAGLLKPNVVSVGVSTIIATPAGNAGSGSGTSYATPNMAGLVACLWQAFPEFTNMDIMNAVQQSASKYSNPDFRFGYGIPNFRIAYGLLQTLRDARTNEGILGDKWIKAYPVPFNNGFKVVLKAPGTGKASLRLTNIVGQTIETREMDVQEGEIYVIDYQNVHGLSKGVYYIRYTQGSNKQTLSLLRR